ncbi:hypothetical protein [uncultured Limimaricola sp.]|uniref:hypothetical protein n=1 Tax=uncultured Limimaricola sp. TaxID=2211667 RepID=UPI0030F5328D
MSVVNERIRNRAAEKASSADNQAPHLNYSREIGLRLCSGQIFDESNVVNGL